MSDIFYDDALPCFVGILREGLSDEAISQNLFLRDPSGRLTFVVLQGNIPPNVIRDLTAAASARLAPYVDDDGFALATPDDLFDDSLVLSSASKATLTVDGSDITVNLIDRRIIGADWLQPAQTSNGIPRLVFASLKGGVGRSTALCVSAAALAKSGHRVLAIDMDVEAPGLGSMLLTAETAPQLGLLDYLVEANFGREAAELVDRLISPSWLSDGSGIIDVLPALGSRSLSEPTNVLSKVARAYVSPVPSAEGITRRMQSLLNALEETNRYDVILIDARAGLHETTGAALLGLGAQILFFGTNQPQTYAAYKLLFANLFFATEKGLDAAITVVHAKASTASSARSAFADVMRSVIAESKPNYRKTRRSAPPVKSELGFEVDWETDESLLEVIMDDLLEKEDQVIPVVHILESESFRDFDPLDRPEALTHDVYDAVYGNFVRHIFNLADLQYIETSDA